MKVDFYTKAILTLIAIFLGVLSLRPIIEPEGAFAGASDKFGNLAFASYEDHVLFFDRKTGDVFNYFIGRSIKPYFGRIVELGEPLVKPKKKK